MGFKYQNEVGSESLWIYVVRHRNTGLEVRGILVANATMFSHLLLGFSCG